METTAPDRTPPDRTALADAASTHDDRLTVMGLLAETWAGLSARSNAQLGEHGLSGVEFEVLVRLARSPSGLLRMTDLAAQTSLTTSGVTRVVDRLVERGLVERQACSTDRRTTYAVISGPGREGLAAALPGHLEVIETWLVGPLREIEAARGAGGAPADGLERFTASLRVLRDRLVPCATAGSSGRAGESAQSNEPPGSAAR